MFKTSPTFPRVPLQKTVHLIPTLGVLHGAEKYPSNLKPVMRAQGKVKSFDSSFSACAARMQKMRVYLNNKEMETAESTLASFLQSQALLETRGIAVAVNEEVIPRNEWARQALHENDSILIITATQGG
jgi:sulfur carrier protein